MYPYYLNERLKEMANQNENWLAAERRWLITTFLQVAVIGMQIAIILLIARL